jgi:SAM-dependent methyltransferase
MDTPIQRVLDVGCGRKKTAGAIGIDINRNSDADIIFDLDQAGYPFKANIFDVIICQDVVEHVDNLQRFFDEIHRIAKTGAVIKIRTPHYSSWYAYNDPTHRHYFGHRVFEYFGAKFKIVRKEIVFSRIFRLLGIKRLANRYPDRYEQLFAFIFPAENMYFELEVIK